VTEAQAIRRLVKPALWLAGLTPLAWQVWAFFTGHLEAGARRVVLTVPPADALDACGISTPRAAPHMTWAIANTVAFSLSMTGSMP